MAYTVDQSFMETARREAAMLACDLMGAQRFAGELGKIGFLQGILRTRRSHLRDMVEQSSLATILLDPRPGLRIVDSNLPHSTVTMANPRRIAGQKLFLEFPDNPSLGTANGVSNLFESLQKVAFTRQAHSLAVQRYDVRDADGMFVERYWRARNSPIFDENGKLLYLVHQIEAVTADGKPLGQSVIA